MFSMPNSHTHTSKRDPKENTMSSSFFNLKQTISKILPKGLLLKASILVVMYAVIPTLGRLRREDCEFKDSPGYTVSPYL
jgi:hypothetical protein